MSRVFDRTDALTAFVDFDRYLPPRHRTSRHWNRGVRFAGTSGAVLATVLTASVVLGGLQ